MVKDKIKQKIGKQCLIYRDKSLIEKKYCSSKKNFRKVYNPEKGIENHKYFYAFVFGGLLGTIYEDVLIYFLKGIWELHSGVLWLPFNPLYGLGCVAFIWVLSHFKEWYHQVTYGALIGGAIEYYCSFFQELFIKSTSWNYSNKITNIDGRTTVLYSIGWGIIGYAIYTYFLPVIEWILRRIPYSFGERVTKFFKIFLLIVIIISELALFRCSFKLQGREPLTVVGQWLDTYLPLEFVKKFFVNMKFK